MGLLGDPFSKTSTVNLSSWPALEKLIFKTLFWWCPGYSLCWAFFINELNLALCFCITHSADLKHELFFSLNVIYVPFKLSCAAFLSLLSWKVVAVECIELIWSNLNLTHMKSSRSTGVISHCCLSAAPLQCMWSASWVTTLRRRCGWWRRWADQTWTASQWKTSVEASWPGQRK